MQLSVLIRLFIFLLFIPYAAVATLGDYIKKCNKYSVDYCLKAYEKDLNKFFPCLEFALNCKNIKIEYGTKPDKQKKQEVKNEKNTFAGYCQPDNNIMHI